jgi:pyruvate/2-oxoglutarate/acetoin dehydrogenase E1 component
MLKPVNAGCLDGAELAAQIGEELFDELDGPVLRVAAKDVPMPFSPPLERYVLPGPADVIAAVRRLR